MGKVLSQEELDALMASARAIDRDTRSRTGEGASDAARYDFGRPDRTSKDQIRVVELLLERFAGNLATSLSAYLRATFEAKLVSVEQFTYAEALRSLPDPTAIYALSLAPFDGRGALEIGSHVALTIIDRLLGGRGRCAPVTRALTEIEQNVMDAVARLVLERLSESVRPVHDVQFKVQGREPQAARQLLEDAKRLADAGVFAIVLECLPTELADQITASIPVPTIGIGAGSGCDGQILVYQDMLGLYGDRKPRFVKVFADAGAVMREGFCAYAEAVRKGEFPEPEHAFYTEESGE